MTFTLVKRRVGIISTATTFAAVIPDIVLGTTGMSLFFIFATNEVSDFSDNEYRSVYI